jgi:hypothetical protein
MNKILPLALATTFLLSTTQAFALGGHGPVIPNEAILNCEKLGGKMGSEESHAVCTIDKAVLRQSMEKLGLISRDESEDEACEYWQEKGFPPYRGERCHISYSALIKL